VKLAVAVFSPDRFGREIQPSEAEIKAYHEENSDQFRSEEQRLVTRIVLPFVKKDRDAVRKKAEEVLAMASKGKADFDAQAKAYARGEAGRRGSRERTPAKRFPGPCSRPPWTPWSGRSNSRAALSSPG